MPKPKRKTKSSPKKPSKPKIDDSLQEPTTHESHEHEHPSNDGHDTPPNVTESDTNNSDLDSEDEKSDNESTPTSTTIVMRTNLEETKAIQITVQTAAALSVRPDTAIKALTKLGRAGTIELQDVFNALSITSESLEAQNQRAYQVLKKIVDPLIDNWYTKPTSENRHRSRDNNHDHGRKAQDNVMKTFGKNINLTEWDQADPYTTLETHVNDTKRLLDWENGTTEEKSKRLILFGSSFKGKTLANWNAAKATNTTTNPDTKLAEILKHVNRKAHRTPAYKLEERFTRYKQKDRSITTYLQEAETRYRRNQHLGIPMAEARAADILIGNLSDKPTRATLRSLKLTDIDEVVDRLTNVYDNETNSDDDTKEENSSTTADPKTDLAALMVARIIQTEDTDYMTQKDIAICQQTAEKHSDWTPDRVLAYSQAQAIRCYACGRRGHMSYNCRNKNKRKSRQPYNRGKHEQPQQPNDNPNNQYQKMRNKYKKLKDRVAAIEAAAAAAPAESADDSNSDDSHGVIQVTTQTSDSDSDTDSHAVIQIATPRPVAAVRLAGKRKSPRSPKPPTKQIRKRVRMITSAKHALTGRTMQILLDTGAGVNVMTREAAERLQLPMIPDATPLKGLKGRATTSGRTMLPLKFEHGNKRKAHTLQMLIIDGELPGAEVIIGDQTLTDWGAMLDYGSTPPKVKLATGETILLTSSTATADRTPRIALAEPSFEDIFDLAMVQYSTKN